MKCQQSWLRFLLGSLLIVSLNSGVAKCQSTLETNSPDFVQPRGGIDLGSIAIGGTSSNFIRACNITSTSALAEAVWQGLDIGVDTAGPFKLETTRYNLKGGFLRNGECHNFYVTFSPTSPGRVCAWLEFVLSFGASDRYENTTLICGSGVLLERPEIDPKALDATYRRFLNRPVDAGAAQFWASRTVTLRTIVRTIALSDEHADRNFGDGLDMLYRELLARPLDSDGHPVARSWLMNSGADYLINALVDSDEYQTKFGTMNIPGVSGADGTALSLRQRLDFIYVRFLGRLADDGAVAYWQQHPSSVREIIRNIALSDEHKSRLFGTGLRNLYQEILDRPADQGFATALSWLGSIGTSYIANQFIDSAEYSNKWGDNLVPGGI